MTTVLQLIIAKIDEQLTNIETDLAAGSATDFEAYKFATGAYRGLRMAKGVMQDVIEEADKDGLD
jgi:hypothetical protein